MTWMMPAAMLAGNALSGIMGMFGANNANAMSNSLAQQQMMQQQGFVNAQRMDQYNFAERNENFQREMAGLGMQHAADMFWLGNTQAENMFNANAALQREFAQNGIRWRMDDAAAAGVHPLFAMGAGGASAAPIQVGGGGTPAHVSGSPSSYAPPGGSPVGVPGFSNPMAGFAGMGQDLARAVSATMTPRERQSDQINFMELQRHQWAGEEHAMRMQVMGSRLAVANQEQKRGGMPESVGPTGLTEKKPYEITEGARPGSPSIGPGQPGTEWRLTGNGLSAFPAQGLNIDEFSSPGYSSWMIPNKLEPFFRKNPDMKPPPEVWKKIWPHAQDVVHHFGIWYPKYHEWPKFTGLRNSRDEMPVTRPGSVKGMFIDRR